MEQHDNLPLGLWFGKLLLSKIEKKDDRTSQGEKKKIIIQPNIRLLSVRWVMQTALSWEVSAPR